jgi:hypothetical protein
MSENQPHVADRHELPRVFAAHGLALNETLVEMLDEHHSHRTERRGSGFTQATRHLAVLVNRPRDDNRETISALFPSWSREHLGAPSDSVRTVLSNLPALLEREESRLLAAIIVDLVSPVPPGERPTLTPYAEPIPVGTCPLAEKYFLEISDAFVRRKGRVNVLVSDEGKPLLVEKLNLGDNHSCISVAELCLNGVRLPPGCLFAVQRDAGVETRAFRLLRLTTLGVSPEHRKRAFTRHFQSQVDAGLFAPGEATIEHLRRVAEGQL